jgi:hypothetical protein
LGTRLLKDALARQNQSDAELAIIVIAVFGVAPEQLDTLLSLVVAGWHAAHENVATLLSRLHDPAAVSSAVNPHAASESTSDRSHTTDVCS